MRVLGLVFLALASASGRTSVTFAIQTQSACAESPTENLLPNVVGPMQGTRPAWMVNGSATWRGSEPIKTLWVLVRAAGDVRIDGHRLDGPGTVKFSHVSDRQTDALVVTNPAEHPIIRRIDGAPLEIMRSYVFLPSNVVYTSPGCWEFVVRLGQQESHIVRELKP